MSRTTVSDLRAKQYTRIRRDVAEVRRDMKSQASKNLTAKELQESFGDTGLKRFGGYIYEEWHKDLQGRNKMRMWREIKDNDTLAGMFLNAIFLLIMQMGWKAEALEDSGDAGLQEAKWLQRNMDEIKGGFKQKITNMLSVLPFGFSVQEENFKRDKESNRLMWKDFSPRMQESIDQWIYTDDNREVIGFTQQLETPVKDIRPVPLSKCLHLTYRADGDDPEGRSVFRNMFVSYQALKTLRWIEGVAFERNANGMPTFFVPPEMLTEGADPADAALIDTLYDYARQMSMDERMGNVLPGEIDKDGAETGFKFRIMTAEGAAPLMAALDRAITRYEMNEARVLGVEFMMMGGTSTGSNAMHTDKTSFFGMQVDAIADMIEYGLNTQSVPRLFKYSQVPKENQARIRHGKIDQSTLLEVMTTLEKLILTGLVVPTQQLGDHVLKMANVPTQDDLEDSL